MKKFSFILIKNTILLVVSFTTVIIPSKIFPTKDIDEHASLQNFTAHLDERIPALMEDYGIPGVNIALIKQGKTAWVKAYGFADINIGRRMTTNTYCRVESISKSVTAWGVMKLVEQGKIELDRPVKHYIKNWRLPESEYAEEKVTVRMLLSHSAGMPLGTIGKRYSPKDEQIPSLEQSLSNDAVLQHEPGQSFFYSNSGFNFLELLIEEVTGRDFADYMAEEVLGPLGMNHSAFTWNGNWQPAVPYGYDLNGNPIAVYIYPSKAAGGLFSSVKDIAAFVIAGMSEFSSTGNNVLNPQNIEKLYTPAVEIPGIYGFVFDSYGFGHFIERLPGGQKAVSHGGHGSGWMTHFHSVPQTGDGIVILTNSQRSWPAFAYILSDWACWSGLDSVGMEKIILGQKILWFLIGLLIFIFLWLIVKIGQGLVSGIRKFAPLSPGFGLQRIVQSIGFLVCISILIWASAQDYFFLSSAFPIAANWLGLAILLLAVALLLSALFPFIEAMAKLNV